MHFISSDPWYRQSSCRCFRNGIGSALHSPPPLALHGGRKSIILQEAALDILAHKLAGTVLCWTWGENGWMGISLSILQRKGEFAIWKSLFYSTI